VEHSQEADPGAKVLRIGGDLEQGLGSGLEEDAVDHPGVLQGNRAERCREREDHVVVGNR
jgi:hypothetical protein